MNLALSYNDCRQYTGTTIFDPLTIHEIRQKCQDITILTETRALLLQTSVYISFSKSNDAIGIHVMRGLSLSHCFILLSNRGPSTRMSPHC